MGYSRDELLCIHDSLPAPALMPVYMLTQVRHYGLLNTTVYQQLPMDIELVTILNTFQPPCLV